MATTGTTARTTADARAKKGTGSGPGPTASSREAGGATVEPTAAKSGAKRASKAGSAARARPARKKAGTTRAGAAGKAKPAKKAAPDRKAKAAPAAKGGDATPAPAGTPKLPEGYAPTPDEEYMGPMQLEYFRNKLLDWRQALFDESEQTLESMREQPREVSDEAERASRETEMNFELRARDRYRKLIHKINQALSRIEDGSYGYCEETGDPIGLGRLEARPIATLSVEAQERREKLERQYRP